MNLAPLVMDLTSEAIVLKLTGEFNVLETMEDHLDRFHGFGEHGLAWNTWLDVADFNQLSDLPNR